MSDDGNAAPQPRAGPHWATNSFDTLPVATRRRLTDEAIALRQTQVYRWVDLAGGRWTTRAEIASAMLARAGATAVLDLGCGRMDLEKALPRGIAYIPSDVVTRDSRTLVCDLNREAPPPVEADAVACLGVLEYLFDPSALVATLAARHAHAVVSYNPFEPKAGRAFRRNIGWFNDLTLAEARGMLTASGWSILEEQELPNRQVLWRLGRV